jgi:hypothetical protein
MSSLAISYRPRKAAGATGAAPDRERRTRRKVSATWSLLFLNALTYYSGMSFLPIPSVLGKLITQGALAGAFLMALSVNRRLLVRPNVFLCLVSLLVIEAVVTSLDPQYLGTLYRTFRLAGFVATLWLLTPWWGRRDLLLVRCHLRLLMAALGSVLLGLLLAPGHALEQGRLTGAVWPIPATEVGHYAAIATGLVVVLWLCGHLRGRVTLLVSLVAMTMLILTHTRTALIGMVAGLLVAGLSLIAVKARVRKLFVAGGAIVSLAVVTGASVVTTWLARGEKGQELESLTGRTNFWILVLHLPRTRFQDIFGLGLTNGSIDGLPIDSNWLTAYLEQGLFGVVVCAAMLIFLFVVAFFQPPGAARALALFLITYSLVASFTQVGFADATTYLLEITLAASLVASSPARKDAVRAHF